MAQLSRNAPCPCGSGKKFKMCCLGKPPPQVRRKRLVMPLVVLSLGLALGVYLFLDKGVSLGFAGLGAGVVAAGLVWVFRDPPPPTGGKADAAAINFGK